MTLPRLLLALLPVLALLSAHAAPSPELSAHAARYHTAGKAVLELIITKQVTVPAVATQVDVLLTEGIALTEAYAKANPTGEKLLRAVITEVPALKKLSFDALQTDWHDLGHFAKPGNSAGIDLQDEDNEHFTDPIHAIVHPLLVLKAAEAYAADAKPEHLKTMKEEMEEGLEQADKLLARLVR
jgi:hypothetical protein